MTWKDRLLTPQQMIELAKTADGRVELAEYIMSARLGRGLQQCLEAMGNPVDSTTQQQCYEILCDSVFRVPIDEVLAWANSVAEGLDETNFTAEAVGHC
jgi:hypothetical protein